MFSDEEVKSSRNMTWPRFDIRFGGATAKLVSVIK